MNALTRLSSAALATLAVAPTSCAKEPGDGSVVVAYAWVEGTACATPFAASPQAVTQVRVTLTNGDDVQSVTAACDEEDITINGVKEGSYKVLVEGLDASEDTIADNVSVPPDMDESVSVSEGNPSLVNAELAPTPATIEVALTVNTVDGFAYMCNDAPVKLFNVNARATNFGSLLMAKLDFCTHGTGFKPVPDMDREINGLVMDRVDIEYQSPGGTTLGTLQYPLTGPIGAGKTVKFNVQCVEMECEAKVTFPEEGGGDGVEPTGDGGGTESPGDDSDAGGSSSGGADSTTG